MNIVIASKNKKKIEEITRILDNPPYPPLARPASRPPVVRRAGSEAGEKWGQPSRLSIGGKRELESALLLRIFTLNDFPGCPDVIEDGETFEANAVKKAISVAKFTGMTSLADDSGLEVYALNRAPGVLSARYAGEDADDKRNVEKLLYEMRSFTGDKRKARFVCSVALASPEGNKNTFFGYIEGTIGTEPKGTGGFGYDPVFYPEGYTKAFSEMDESEKDSISHRGMAIKKACQALLKEYKKKL
ncbi:MAG: RdgB/HAM1 family non-canonical purine NTP pyrophosphatase [Nitrospirota bacterium]